MALDKTVLYEVTGEMKLKASGDLDGYNPTVPRHRDNCVDCHLVKVVPKLGPGEGTQ